MTNQISASILPRLFANRGTNVFAVVDGASVPGLLDKLCAHQPEFECLYRGELEPDLAEVAPYLVLLGPQSALTNWLLEEGWDNHWGIFAVSGSGLSEMRRHFRRFLIVHDNEGQPLYFRYYDPRVLPVYLQTCNAEELKVVFGPVVEYILESNNRGTMHCFRMEAGRLVQEEVALST